MTSEQTPTPFIVTITKQLPLVEKVLLTALAIGTILTVMEIDSTVTRISLLGLGVTFFLLAYRPNDIPRQEGEQLGFSDLLGLMIVPKVLWISSAISALGIAFYLFDFGNDGYKKMLMIGGLTISIGTILLIVFFVSGVKHIRTVVPILLRAVPLCLVDFYILFK
jgi:energy-converting hydrogenase Eha subunit C